MVAAQTPASAAEPMFVVPFGRVGDRVMYSRIEPSSGDQRVALELIVNSTGHSLDETGIRRDAVVIRWRPTVEDFHLSSAYVDLDSRQVLRRDHGVPLDNTSSGFVNVRPQNAGVKSYAGLTYGIVSDYGPSLSPAWYDGTDTSILWLQGQALRLGADLAPLTKSLFAGLWGLDTERGVLLSYESRVVQVGRYGDVTAFEVLTEGHVRFSVPEPPDADVERHKSVRFLGFELYRHDDVTFSRSSWFSADSPYPLTIDDRIVVNGNEKRAVWNLGGLETGASPIPWLAASPSPVQAAPSMQRSPPDQPFPDRGTPPPARIRWDEAFAKIEGDPTFADFRAWRMAQSSVHLIGMKAQCWESGCHWDLVFATPTGDGYGLYMRLTDGEPTVVDRQDELLSRLAAGGPVRTPSFDPQVFPYAPVTISQFAKQWATFSARAGFPPELPGFEWGIWNVQMSQDRQTLRETWGELDDLRSLRTRASQSAVDRENNTFLQIAELIIDVETGFIERSDETAYYDAEELGSRSPPPPGSSFIWPASVTAAGGPIEILPAVAVSGSLLAVWLTLYFFPLWKYLLGQAPALMPGYAKLRKDRLLNHQLRDELMHLIRNDPGISATNLAKHVTAGWSTVVYHLGVLERNKLVTSTSGARHRRFFPVGQMNHREHSRIAVLKNDRTREILELIQREPGLIQGTVAQRMAMTLPGASWHLERLEEAGLIVRKKQGRAVLVSPVQRPTGAAATFPVAQAA